jgi:hypothetical protein
VVVPKQGKTTYQDPKSYRPISLLSCFGKVLESLMAQRVSKAAEECGAVVDTQMGGRKNYSAVDALINISTPMRQSLRRDKCQNPKTKHSKTLPRLSLLIHDIDGAFNNTDPEVLTQIMEQRRPPSYMILCISPKCHSLWSSFSSKIKYIIIIPIDK